MASNRELYEPVARAAADRYGVPADTFVRQIDQESGFQPDAYNAGSGASGIAQIISRFHPDVDPWDAPAALDYAARWMADLRQRFGTWRQALAAYNWGPGHVAQWDGQRASLPAETRRYLDNILGAGWPEPAPAAPIAEYVFPIVGYSGPVNTHWGTGERGGSDLFAPKGTPLVVMHGGRVQYTGYDALGGYNCVIVGDDALSYYYAHADWLAVQTGQRVVTGEPLGAVGDTGNAAGTGPHLHIGIGYGIHTGGGPQGGCGINYDAVGLLQRVLTGQEGDDPVRIAELEAELAHERQWGTNLLHEIKGWAETLDAVRGRRLAQGWEEVKNVSSTMHETATPSQE